MSIESEIEVIRELGKNVKVTKFTQPLNAVLPIASTLSGIVTPVKVVTS
jgi:hypothetical protein